MTNFYLLQTCTIQYTHYVFFVFKKKVDEEEEIKTHSKTTQNLFSQKIKGFFFFCFIEELKY